MFYQSNEKYYHLFVVCSVSSPGIIAKDKVYSGGVYGCASNSLNLRTQLAITILNTAEQCS